MDKLRLGFGETSSRLNMAFKITGVQWKALNPMVLGSGNTSSFQDNFFEDNPSRLVMDSRSDFGKTNGLGTLG